MAASPISGERSSGFRRSSSQFAALPQRSLSFHEKAGLAKGDAEADVLYTHPSVKIFHFQPPTDALEHLDKTKKTLPDADYPIDAIEVLPWRSRTETLSAKGKLIIEKVQGSVHFLKSGHLIHTIMRNSQCWCVDGESKFVMRVGRLRYQRIEFPTAEPEDKEKVAEFKEVIAKILKFEKTPCPFIRGFQVDLPEDAITPRRRGTWKRKESLPSNTQEDGSSSMRRSKATRAMSMRGTPPTSFPSRSLTYLDNDRPRTASSPMSAPRFSFPDVRTDSPTNYTSGEDNTDSDRHDSESDRPESSQHSEVEDSDREIRTVPIIRSPLKNVQTASITRDMRSESPDIRPPEAAARRSSTVGSQIKMFEQFKAKPAATIIRRDSQAQSRSIDAKKLDLSTRISSGSISDSPSIPTKKLISREHSPDIGVVSDTDSSEGFTIERNQSPMRAVLNQPEDGFSRVDDGMIIPDVESAPIVQQETSVPVEQDLGEPALHKDVSPEEAQEPISIGKVDQHLGTHQASAEDIEDLNIGSTLRATDLIQSSAIEPLKTEMVDLQRTYSNEDAASMVSSDSFHTMLSDEALDQHDNALPESLNTRPFSHRRELSERTVTAASMQYDAFRAVELPKDQFTTSSLPQEFAGDLREPLTPGAFVETSELRQRLRHRRSLSPLPPASILRPPSPTEQGSPLPAVLLQKAAALAVVKPIEVVFFVARILARIAQGATMNDLVSGDLFRRPGGPRRTASGSFEQAIHPRGRTPVRKAISDEEEDDYGLPVLGRRRSSNKDRQEQVPADVESSSQSSLD